MLDRVARLPGAPCLLDRGTRPGGVAFCHVNGSSRTILANRGEKCTSQFQNRPSTPRAIPGHLTRVNLPTLGNLTQNDAHPVGHLTFVSRRLSAVGSKRISQFFDSAGEPRSRVIALVDYTWVFLLLSFYIVISWNMPLLKVWSEDKLNKKFVVAENFAEFVSQLEGGGFDPL